MSSKEDDGIIYVDAKNTVALTNVGEFVVDGDTSPVPFASCVVDKLKF